LHEIGLKVWEDFEKINALEAENSRLVSRVSELEKRLAFYDKDQRRNNIVVFGVATDTDLNEAIDDVIHNKLSLEKCPREKLIERAYRFGRDAPQRPILIRFNNESDKKRVMNSAPKLRGTKITISDDLTSDERRNRRKIVDAHKAARAENIESKVMRNGLLVNGQILPPSELETSDWMEMHLVKKNSAPEIKVTETSPSANPKQTTPKAPTKKKHQR
jgi:hypothetical protein